MNSQVFKVQMRINHSLILRREGLILTLSILPCPVPTGMDFLFHPWWGECPYSTKTQEVLGNPSSTSKRFPETREITWGQSPREISRVVFVEHGYNDASLWGEDFLKGRVILSERQISTWLSLSVVAVIGLGENWCSSNTSSDFLGVSFEDHLLYYVGLLSSRIFSPSIHALYC